MRTSLFFAVAVAVIGCSDEGDPKRQQRGSTVAEPAVAQTAESDVDSQGTVNTNVEDAAPSDVDPSATETSTLDDADDNAPSKVKPLTAEQQDRLLNARLNGGMGYSFSQFANMFLVSSRIKFGTGIGLMTSSAEIAEAPLQSPFPENYKPTLRQFLDTIALQTSSDWEYDPSGKFIQGDFDRETPIDGLAIYEFKKTERDKPFEITLEEGWEAIDKGNWVMHVPPSFPIGMDIYELGEFSSDKNMADQEFTEKIRLTVSLDWAQRLNENAKEDDLQPAKVGDFEALYYESLIPSQLDKEIKWRQWVFLDGNKCYFIVSTILPEMEDDIYPDVEKMVASFRIKPTESAPSSENP